MLSDLEEHALDWYIELRSRGLMPSTVGKYRDSVDRFVAYLREHRYSLDPSELTARHLRRYLADLSDAESHRRPGQKVSPSYVSLQYRNLQQFFKYLKAEGVASDLFGDLKPPKVPEVPIPVFSEQELVKLLEVCKGKEFDNRRDHAILRMFIDTGVRVSEMVQMTVDGIDFTAQTVSLIGKGRKPRVVVFGDKTMLSVRRYLRVRPDRPTPSLWVGRQRGLTTYGVRQITERRGREAGVHPCNPHRFRHTFAHRWLAAGGGETDLMRLTGWSSRSMLDRYGASAASERAVEAHRRAGLGDL